MKRVMEDYEVKRGLADLESAATSVQEKRVMKTPLIYKFVPTVVYGQWWPRK